MSLSIISSLNLIAQQINIYLSLTTLVAGVLGGFLNISVFLSLRTFRQSSCAFYLTIMSIVNIGQLITGLLSRIMISGFAIDWTQTSLFYCKFRLYFLQVCSLTSMTCFCMATIDQYFVTCTYPRWQQWSNIKLARRLSAITVLVWILHNIPYLIYYNQVISTDRTKITCTVTNNVFQQYITYVTLLFLGRILPVSVALIFGLMAYRNIQRMAHRALPLVRRVLDKQLTVMVLVQIVVTFFTLVPYVIAYILPTIPIFTQDPFVTAQLQFASSTTLCIYYMNFASPFYIYFCVSNRFRRQLKYVLFDIHLKRCRQVITANEVAPQVHDVD